MELEAGIKINKVGATTSHGLTGAVAPAGVNGAAVLLKRRSPGEKS